MSDYIKRLAGPYYGEGDKTFTFGFFTYTKEDIYVGTSMSNDEATTILELDVDYSVSLNEDQDATPGGTITLLNESGLKKGEALVIGSDLEPVKNIQLTNYSRFPPEQIDTEFNRIFIILQQIYEITGRTLEVPATSNETPEEMIERLLAAQKTAQSAADAAEAAKDAAEDILEDVQEYGEAASVLEPIAEEIKAVADSVEAVEATGENITNVNIVAGDLDTTTQKIRIDYGIYGHGTGSGAVEVPTGGNIVTVAQNIEDIKTVAENIEDIVSITAEIDKVPGYLEDMEEQVGASKQNAQNALGSANSASASAQDAATQKNLAKDWAIKLDGKIVEAEVEIDFSAKYWAQQAFGFSKAAEQSASDAETAKTDAVTAKNQAETAAGTATTKAGEAAQSAIDAGNAKTAALTAQTAAETARAAAEAAQEAAEDAAQSVGDPLSKTEAAATYLTKTDASSTYATKTEVTNGLAGKAALEHTHEIADVTGLQTALDGKQPVGSYAPATHTHTASQVTDLGTIATKNEITAAELAASIDLGVYSNA